MAKEPDGVQQTRAREGVGDPWRCSGKELWIAEPRMDAAMVVEVAATVAGLAAIVVSGRTWGKFPIGSDDVTNWALGRWAR